MPGKMILIQGRARLKGWKDSARRSNGWRLSLLELAEEETELRMVANPCEMDVPTLPMIDSGRRCYSGSSTDRATLFTQLCTGRRKAGIPFFLFEKAHENVTHTPAHHGCGPSHTEVRDEVVYPSPFIYMLSQPFKNDFDLTYCSGCSLPCAAWLCF